MIETPELKLSSPPLWLAGWDLSSFSGGRAWEPSLDDDGFQGSVHACTHRGKDLVGGMTARFGS